MLHLRFLLVCLLPLAAAAQPWNVGQSYFSSNGYIEYRPGNLPIIISTPHGGTITPANIPDRTCNSPVLVLDSWTTELGLQTDSALLRRTGCRPHLIICHLRRSKMDANRSLADGACGNADAAVAWTAFHNWLDTARKIVTQQHGKGFYIDLHAHGHTVQQMELGYLLTGSELRKTDAQLVNGNYRDSCSIRMLTYTNASSQSFTQLLRGPDALGTALASRGYPSVPSQQKPAPDTSESYFNGGYNTANYTSYKGGTVDGVQIETNYTGVRDNSTNRRKFGDTLAVSLLGYLKKHYFPGATFAGCTTTGITAATANDGALPFPNPGHGYFRLSVQKGARCTVSDAHGRAVQRLEENGGLIQNVTNLAPGLYSLQVRSRDGKIFMHRLVVLPE